MPHSFKIWNQGNDGRTMGIRVEDLGELHNLAPQCNQPDIAGSWPHLEGYLHAAEHATGFPPPPYTRIVDVVWLSTVGYGGKRFFPDRTFVVTYTGPARASGGFASQAYCIVDADGYHLLAPHHRSPLTAEYITSGIRDVIVIL